MPSGITVRLRLGVAAKQGGFHGLSVETHTPLAGIIAGGAIAVAIVIAVKQSKLQALGRAGRPYDVDDQPRVIAGNDTRHRLVATDGS